METIKWKCHSQACGEPLCTISVCPEATPVFCIIDGGDDAKWKEIDWQNEPYNPTLEQRIERLIEDHIGNFAEGLQKTIDSHIAGCHSDYIDDGKEEFKAVTDESHGEKIIRTLETFVAGLKEHGVDYLEGRMLPPIQYEPMPDGYLVVPDPAGREWKETMMHNRLDGKWNQLLTYYDGENLQPHWKEGEIIDIAENVLPEAPKIKMTLTREDGTVIAERDAKVIDAEKGIIETPAFGYTSPDKETRNSP